MPKANVKKKESTTKKDKNPEKQESQQSTDINSEWRKLKRVIYFTDVTSRYIAGNPELFFLKKYDSNISFISDILKKPENVGDFLDILKTANRDPKLPRRVTLIYVLAYALRNHPPDNNLANLIADTVLEICQTDEEFFKFISVFSFMGFQIKNIKHQESYNKITTSVSRIIRKFLEKKTPTEYATAVAFCNGYHSWKYKDLIKLAHYKSETTEKSVVTDYVLRGLDSLKEPETEDIRNIHKILKDWNALRQPSDDITKICDLIGDLKASYRNVCPKYVKHQEVWAAIIPNLKIEEVMQLLPKFLKYKMLEPTETSVLHAKVKEVLSIPRTEFCNVNVLEVFIHWKNFQKGGKPIDPKLEHYLKTNKLPVKVPSPIPEDNTISQLLYKYYHDSQPSNTLGLNKNVMLILDVTHFDSVCFKQRNITCLEAEVALATYFSKTEKNIDLTVFNGDSLEPFELVTGCDSFRENLKKLKNVKGSRINMYSAFDRAVSTKRNVDVFIYFLQTAKSLPSSPKEFRKVSKDALREYQGKINNKDVRIIVVCLGSHSLAPFPDCMNALTICGFCPEIPNVIQSFVNMDLPKSKQQVVV